jgi:hypothetical protein
MKCRLLCFLVSTGLQLAFAAHQCGNADFMGSYAVSSDGTVVQGPPGTSIAGPFARLAKVRSSGDGTLIASYARGSYNGIVYSEPFDGVYTVRPDCTISFIINAPPPTGLPVPFQGVVLHNSREVRVMAGGPGAVVSATMRKQSLRDCSTETFVGSFAFELSGQILPPSPQAGPFLRLGRLISFGDGTFAVGTAVTYNGLFTFENLLGTYRLDADCKLTLQYSEAGPSEPRKITIEGLLYTRDNADLLVTDPAGITITGRLGR